MFGNPFKRKPNGLAITFLPMNKTVKIELGTSVLQAAIEHHVDLPHACDGNLACATCHVYVRQGEAGLTPPTVDEDHMLESADKLLSCSRLACQLKPSHDVTVEIP